MQSTITDRRGLGKRNLQMRFATSIEESVYLLTNEIKITVGQLN